MTTIGYALSAEEHPPADLVTYARAAEESQFEFALVSDHFHPWIDRQGQSPFVWSVLGGIAQATKRLRVGTGVTCPTTRIHPAIVAQAAATVAAMMPGRFFLGVGTGENLNEHILGGPWPSAAVRLDQLEEAIEVIRALWEGEQVEHYGTHYTVEQARLYTLPPEPPPIYLAAKGKRSAETAARIGDGLIGVGPDDDPVEAFEAAGGKDKPKYGQIHVCWAADEAEARRTAHQWWPNVAMKGELGVELPLPRHFEQAAEMVREEDVARSVTCGPDPEAHIQAIRRLTEAGYDHVYVHQIGPDQHGFFRFYEDEVLPKLR